MRNKHTVKNLQDIHKNLVSDQVEFCKCLELEVHPDGVKEAPKCDFCKEFCGNEHCPYNEEKQ